MGNTNATNVKTSAAPVVKSMPQNITTNIVTAATGTGLAQNDTITGPSIPAGAYLVDIIFDSTDLDTAGSPAILWDVGISGTAAKFISATTVSQTGGIARINVAGALGYSPTSDTPVIATVNTAAGTKAAGTVKIAVLYTMDP